MKRLTLRLLLAYLDDVLEPAQTREVGQRLAESEAARQLIARIKQVTRKRSITTPEMSESGGRALDPNLIAEYLNDQLPPDKAAELERLCLENDVYLAEVAACHQLMTLTAAETIHVPPTALERMYGLVKGREAVASRRAAVSSFRKPVAEDGHEEEDEVLLLGLPAFGQKRWWATAGLVAGLAACLLVVFYLAITGREGAGTGGPVALAPTVAPTVSPPTRAATSLAATRPPDPPPPRIPQGIAASWVGKPFAEAPEAAAELGGSSLFAMCTSWAAARPSVPLMLVIIDTQPSPAVKPPDQSGLPLPSPPSLVIAPLGRHVSVDPRDSLMLRKLAGNMEWKRVLPREQVRSADLLVTLPGYRSQIMLNSQVEVELVGNLPELLLNRVLEAAVVLHVPAQEIDLDMTLDRGRVVVTGKANSSTNVRLRVRGQTWDLRLAWPGTKLALELLTTFERGARQPRADLSLFTLQGPVELRTSPQADPIKLAAGEFVLWDGESAPQRFPFKDAIGWVKLPEKLPPEVTQATFSFQKSLATQVANEELQLPFIKLALNEALTPTRSALERQLALYTFAAIDELEQIIKAHARVDVRQVARQTLFSWLSRAPNQADRLRQSFLQAGLPAAEADTALRMLRGYPRLDVDRQALEEVLAGMESSEAIVRFLAYEELREHLPTVAAAGFEPNGTREQRAKSLDALRKQLLK